jgi:hypothetical protein
VDVENLGFVPPQVSPQPPDRDRIHRASEPELEEWETGVGTGRLEISACPPADPHPVSPFGQALRRRKHLHRRPGNEPVSVDQVKDTQAVSHGSSIGCGELEGQPSSTL